MKHYWLLFLCLISCTRHIQVPTEEDFLTFELPDYLMENDRSLKASSLADSIWYIPLETTPETLIP